MTLGHEGRRGLVALLTAAMVLVGGAAGCGDDDDDDGGASGDDVTSTTMATGDIAVEAPDGWTPIPLPVLGFGVALPPGWEATRLDAEGLSILAQAEPLVPGFLDAAHGAARTGSTFYAAGVDAEGRVSDLQVGGLQDTGVTDAAGLEAYAGEAAADAGLGSAEIQPVAGAAQPTVEVRFRAEARRVTGDDPDTTVPLTVEGTQRLVLRPGGTIYVLVLTSEDAAIHDDLAAEILATFVFPPA